MGDGDQGDEQRRRLAVARLAFLAQGDHAAALDTAIDACLTGTDRTLYPLASHRPSTSLNGPVELQQNEHRGHSAPLALELRFDKHSGARNSSSATGITTSGVMGITSLIRSEPPEPPERPSTSTSCIQYKRSIVQPSRGGGEQMRARMLAVLVTAMVLALAAPALAGPGEEAQARRKLLAGQTARAAVIQNGETKENLEQVVVNHFGNPDQGQVLIQTWVEPDWSNFEAVDIQAAAQAVKIRRAGAGFAKRIAIRVELWAEGEPNQFSSTVNTGDVNGTAFVQTPETGGLNTDPNAFCLWFSNASYTIRWDDNTLTSGRFLTAQGDWLNPVCMATPLSDLRVR